MKIPTTHSLDMSLRISAIGIIFDHDEYLKEFLFSHKRLEFRTSPEILIKEASEELNRNDRLLFRSAMDIWNNSGGVRLQEILDNLDNEALLRLIGGILKLREIESINDLLSENF